MPTPPYLLSTRNRAQYRHEMTEGEHVALLETLLAHRGPVLLSGYQSDLYEDLLHGWNKETMEVRNQISAPRTEVLWMNF